VSRRVLSGVMRSPAPPPPHSGSISAAGPSSMAVAGSSP
jgi:hypothetical protein